MRTRFRYRSDMRPMLILSPLAFALALASCAIPISGAADHTLRIAAWNLEHLAEANGAGCRPRSDADYAALKEWASDLNADVVAFQEVENLNAARRVFDPGVYDIYMEARTGTPDSKPPCNGAPQYRLNRQATGFAVRKDLSVERHPDVTSLQVDDPNLRSGVDITVIPPGGRPIRLLTVHLKSGCAGASSGPSCDTLLKQAALLKGWVEDRGKERDRFAILGDFNRRLALADDAVWAKIDGPPGPTDLMLASGATTPKCDPRYNAFIDHIALDPRVVADGVTFEEVTYLSDRLSDHCAILLELSR